MRGIDEIFSNSSKEMSVEEKLAVIAGLGAERARGNSIDVMSASISVSPIGVDVHAAGNATLIERFGLEKEFQDFAKEVSPIAEKFAKVVSEKYRADFEKFVRGGVQS